MKSYDLMILGPATRDVNIDYPGDESRIVGGAVTFCTPSAVAAGAPIVGARGGAAIDPAPPDRGCRRWKRKGPAPLFALEAFQMPGAYQSCRPVLCKEQLHRS